MLQKIFDATNTPKFHGKFESRVNKVSGLRVTRLLKRDSNNCFQRTPSVAASGSYHR